MENYPRLFIKAGLVYALLGAILGIAMAIDPALTGNIRFVHIHFNLLGFMTMFVAGVAFHVLPRFNANPVPWPAGVKYQFYLQNIGLIGMVSLQAMGRSWRGGGFQALFILFAVMAGVAIAFMFYNLYFVLQAPKQTAPLPERITGDMKVSEVLEHFPQSLPLFLQAGFTALANPMARQTFAKVASVAKACEKHDVDAEEFVRHLNVELLDKSHTAPKPAAQKPAEPTVGEGKEIQKGGLCTGDTRVGSLIKVYPAVKTVFEKHYGEGCFSCPGQIYETVEQTAMMHNIDADLILNEINAVIAEENGK